VQQPYRHLGNNVSHPLRQSLQRLHAGKDCEALVILVTSSGGASHLEKGFEFQRWSIVARCGRHLKIAKRRGALRKGSVVPSTKLLAIAHIRQKLQKE
jgi:hypothetical protein